MQLLFNVQREIEKDTSINIEQSGEFVVHITDEAIVNDVNETAAPLEYGVNELKRTSLSMIDSDLIKVPAIKEAKVRFECKLHQIVQLGNKDNGSDLIIGEIVVYHIDEEVYFEDSKIDANQLNPVARLAGNDYSLLGQTFTVNRPTIKNKNTYVNLILRVSLMKSISI